MSTFTYRETELFCEGIPIAKIAEDVGTPFYVYSRKRLESNLESAEGALSSVDHLVCYAMKANGNLNLLRILAEKGCGADVVSSGEMTLALKAGIPPDRIVFAGVGKTDTEIEQAVGQNILSINVESLEELEIIARISRKMKKRARVAVRVTPDIDAKTHHYIATGLREGKFGIELGRAEEAFQRAVSFPELQVEGVHCHIGSMIMEVEPFVEAAGSLSRLVQILKTSGIFLRNIDIGGGLGVDYSRIVDDGLLRVNDNPKVPTPEALFSKVLPVFSDLNMKVLFEPGRYLVADTAALITQVVLIKEGGERKFIIVDAGMNDLIRPSLYDAYHQIVPVRKGNTDVETVCIVGPLCETGDFFARDRLFPQVKRGDQLAVMAAGAYGYVLSSNYNGRPRLPEVLVEEDSYRLIREREKVEDLWRGII